MSEPLTERLLQDVYCREQRSLLHYIIQALPYVSVHHRPLLNQLRDLAEREQACLDQIASSMLQQGMLLPPLGPFAAAYTHYNYVALKTILPKLLQEQSALLTQLNAEATACTDAEPARLLRSLYELKAKHRTELEAMQASLSHGTDRHPCPSR